MRLLLPHVCDHCGETSEANFVYSGPHIKQICNVCGHYVKFVNKGIVPDAGETKLRIWAITKNTDDIQEAKDSIHFVEDTEGLDKRIMYWRLYLELMRTWKEVKNV